jgi:hypothetical protein
MKDIEKQVYRALEIAGSKRLSPLSSESDLACAEKANFFSQFRKPDAHKSLNVVIFHTTIPKEDSVINTIDIKGLDHNSFEYENMIRLNIRVALWSNPSSNVFLITDNQFLSDFEHDGLTIIRSSINTKEPMYERVVAMNSFVRSELFSVPTIFLDSDAFLINNPHSLFQLNFDIGLTHRNIYPQMPINEGVIYANCKNIRNTRNFFDQYLSIYNELDKDPELSDIYQNIRRWRGGQLSINGAAGGNIVYTTGILSDQLGYKKALLPCSRFNLSLQDYSPNDLGIFGRCLVMHFKGPRKSWVDKFSNSLYSIGFC